MFILAQSDAVGGAVAVIGILIGVLLGIAAYFIPTAIAAFRGHHNTMAIFGLNLLLGWTFIGWVASLVWSLSAVEY